MPYIIKKFKNGFKVCKENSNECFSKKQMTKKNAKRQMIAIIINEKKKKKS